MRGTTASSGKGSPSFAMIPSLGPNARPDGTRICSNAFPHRVGGKRFAGEPEGDREKVSFAETVI